MIVKLRKPDSRYPDLTPDQPYAYPPPLNDCGFFEDYFDGKSEAVGYVLAGHQPVSLCYCRVELAEKSKDDRNPVGHQDGAEEKSSLAPLRTMGWASSPKAMAVLAAWQKKY